MSLATIGQNGNGLQLQKLSYLTFSQFFPYVSGKPENIAITICCPFKKINCCLDVLGVFHVRDSVIIFSNFIIIKR